MCYSTSSVISSLHGAPSSFGQRAPQKGECWGWFSLFSYSPPSVHAIPSSESVSATSTYGMWMSETVLYISCAILASFRPTFISQFTSLPQHDAGPIAHILILASSASSVAENLVPTGMIGYTARCVFFPVPLLLNCGEEEANGLNRVYGRVRTSNGHGSQAMRILAMLMESGVLYALIQVCSTIPITVNPLNFKLML